MEYNSSTPQEIAVSGVKALESFRYTHAAIATLTNAPDTIDPESQEEQSGEHYKWEVPDTAEENPIKQEGPEGNRQE